MVLLLQRRTSLLFCFLYLHYFLSAGESPPPAYKPMESIFLACGSSGNSAEFGNTSRTWVGDIGSKFFPSDGHQNDKSDTHYSTNSFTSVPYKAARLSRFNFTYSFPVSPGQKFIRLHFYSTPRSNFDRSKAVFTVKTGLHTLLRDFNASANADASNENRIRREFCVYVDGNNQKLDLTFLPTTINNQDSYAFISGIEIVSMPTNLYYTPPDPNNQSGRGLKLLGQDNQFLPIENHTSLEMVYRMNIGGNRALLDPNHIGMFRVWSEENYLLDEYLDDARPADDDQGNIHLNYSKIPRYTAPDEVYRTARTMGPNATNNKRYNLTWEYSVDSGFFYMVRLHFCEFQKEITHTSDRVFFIYIRDVMAEPYGADVILWAGGRETPIYRDYMVLVSNNEQKKVNLSVKLQANPNDNLTRYTNVILNGIEIFKLNDSTGNLGGQNPDPPPTSPPQSLSPSIPKSNNSSSTKIKIVAPVVAGGVAIVLLALCFFVFRKRLGKAFSDKYSNDGTSLWTPYSISTDKSSAKGRNSNLPSNLCRYFSLSEIKAATKNFDDIFIIGVGGFGDVYKGYIDDGATQVAIKRLKPGSKQGAREFQTEIEMLSQLRHLHLVSLIGYCNDGNEMILVYDYMAHGTLRAHLYGENEKPLAWKQRLQICIGAARGLNYLHTGVKHTIIHRDVKTTNILLDEKWVAKVSDFGLSKEGSASMSKAHISTVVKGSFGYLDPEYYRRQQLTEKSDVFSFGVVLCEVLCARLPLMRTADKKQVYLAEWVRQCNHNNTVAQIIDPNIKDEISLESLRKFIEITVSCIEDEGIKRPSMNDVVWGLEFALQLQDASKKTKGLDKGDMDDNGNGKEEGWLMKNMSFNRTGDHKKGESESGISSVVTASNSDDSTYAWNKGGPSTVFSEIMNPAGR